MLIMNACASCRRPALPSVPIISTRPSGMRFTWVGFNGAPAESVTETSGE